MEVTNGSAWVRWRDLLRDLLIAKSPTACLGTTSVQVGLLETSCAFALLLFVLNVRTALPPATNHSSWMSSEARRVAVISMELGTKCVLTV